MSEIDKIALMTDIQQTVHRLMHDIVGKANNPDLKVQLLAIFNEFLPPGEPGTDNAEW